jgi:hypothetical protein
MTPRRLPGLRLYAGAPARAAARLQRLAARLALRGPVRLLVCGNRFDPYALAYDLARHTGEYHVLLAERIALARAETAHQWLALLGRTPADGLPILASDLLAPLHDEDLPGREADDLIFQGLLELRRLAAAGPVAVSAAPDPARPGLYAALLRECATVRAC